jgi:hypothetical protein
MLQMNEWDFRRQGGREQDLEIWKSRIAGITVTSDRGRRRHQAKPPLKIILGSRSIFSWDLGSHLLSAQLLTTV